MSWREGLFLVGPDPLTSPYYSSGALIVAGVGYAAPAFQIGLYSLLFVLAPLYIEAVLLTLSNGGTYVMTRYALSHLGKFAIAAAAIVGVIISFSYVATALVSLLSYSGYVASLATALPGPTLATAILLSAIPSIGFGVWVMPSQWLRVLKVVAGASLGAAVLSTVFNNAAVVMLAPLAMLFTLNNEGLKESVQVSKSIFLINLVVMGVTILMGLIYLAMYGADLGAFTHGRAVPASTVAHDGVVIPTLPGFLSLGAAAALAGVGSSILGASGVESVMNIPEELERPRRDIPKIYRWMLSLLLGLGGSISLLIFLVLTPEELASKTHHLLSALGYRAVLGVTGVEALAQFWQVVVVANAALMLIGATNTGFAGARGLWLTMTRDSLLPRGLLQVNERGTFPRVHVMMLISIFLLANEASWDVAKLERWYGASFGLVMFSGMVAFVMLRRFKGSDRRVYKAPYNVTIAGVSLPIGALIGMAALGYALLSLYASFHGDMGELRGLVTTVGVLIAGVLLLYNHRPLIRSAVSYLRSVIETVESTAIETEDRTIVVSVGSVRIGNLVGKAAALAQQQTKTTGIPYRQLVVFHMTPDVTQEQVYLVHSESIRPVGIPSSAVRIFTELTERAPAEMRCYLALAPPVDRGERDTLKAALETLVAFHENHNFRGHIIMVGTYGVARSDLGELQDRLEGSTLVPVPLYGED